LGFQRGNKLAKGGARPGSGPKTKAEIAIRQSAQELARDFIETTIRPVLLEWLRAATSGDDGATTRHFIDKVLPELHEQPVVQPAQINFIQFNQLNNHTAQLPPQRLPGAILAGDGGQEARSEGMASTKREGHDRPEFHAYANVERKRG
jgi:hypothetical protein